MKRMRLKKRRLRTLFKPKKGRRRVMMMRRKKVPGKRLYAKPGSPTRSYTTLGKLRRATDKTAAILEYYATNSKSVFSGNTSLVVAYADSGGGATGHLEYCQRVAGTDYTASTALSGCQCVFAVNLANSQMVYNGTDNWWAKLPSPVSSTLGNTRSQPFKIVRYEAETSITNTSNIMVEIKMYDYICRNDLYTSTGAGSVLATWQDGLYYQGINGAQTAHIYDVMATPFDSQKFTQFFKVVKTHVVQLAAGATHTHVHKHNVHRNFYPQRFITTTGYIEGLSSGTIYCATGQPVEATAGSVGAVTTGIVDLNVVSKYKAEISQKYNNKAVYTAAATGNALYQAVQATGVFKAMIDSSYSWSAEIEGG